MNLYLYNYYLNFRSVYESPYPFIIIIGGRGTGKTFGALQYCIDEEIPFLLMRRTQIQMDMISKDETSPFKSLERFGYNPVKIKPVVKGLSGYYNIDEEGNAAGKPLGYGCALSTIANIRGFDMTNVKVLLYDEFISEQHVNKMKNEASAFLNAYETINRNRELEGQEPLKAVLMANANDMSNPILMELDLVRVLEKMIEKEREIYIDKGRGLCLIYLLKSKISEKKGDTVLYKLTSKSAYSKMALNNAFAYEDIGRIKQMPIKEYKPVFTLGEITVYEHKNRREWYITQHVTGSPEKYTGSETDILRVKRRYRWVYKAYMENKIIFENYLCEVLFRNYLY